MTHNTKTSLSREARDLLEHMEFVRGGVTLDNCPEAQELFAKGYLDVDFMKAFGPDGPGCFYAWVYITTQGISIAKGLH